MANKEQLKAALDLFNTKNTFKPGDIVEWKSGLKNRRVDGPYIVTEILETPVRSSDEAGISYYCDMSDIKLGTITSDGEFIEFVFDSRRFQLLN